jgi:hypothetical protein
VHDGKEAFARLGIAPAGLQRIDEADAASGVRNS